MDFICKNGGVGCFVWRYEMKSGLVQARALVLKHQQPTETGLPTVFVQFFCALAARLARSSYRSCALSRFISLAEETEIEMWALRHRAEGFGRQLQNGAYQKTQTGALSANSAGPRKRIKVSPNQVSICNANNVATS